MSWESLVVHMIKRYTTTHDYFDGCIYSGGGYSISFSFWWYLEWDSQIDIMAKNAKMGKNELANNAAAFTTNHTDGLGADPHHVLLLACTDNCSAVHLINKICYFVGC